MLTKSYGLKTCGLVVLAVLLAVPYSIGLSQEGTSGAKSHLEWGGYDTESLMYLWSDGIVVAGGITEVRASPYDAAARLSFLVNFVSNPSEAAHSRIYFLYDMRQLSEEETVELFTNVAFGDAGYAMFLTAANSANERAEFFGTPFIIAPTQLGIESGIVQVRSGSGGIAKATLEELDDPHLSWWNETIRVAGKHSIDAAAPKSRENLPPDAPIYIATSKAVSDVPTAGQVWSTYEVPPILDEIWGIKNEIWDKKTKIFGRKPKAQ